MNTDTLLSLIFFNNTSFFDILEYRMYINNFQIAKARPQGVA